jgi:hypothetical protein
MIGLLIIEDVHGLLRTALSRERVTHRQLASHAQSGDQSVAYRRSLTRTPTSCGVSRSRSRGWHAFAVSTGTHVVGVDIECLQRSEQARRACERFLGEGDDGSDDDAVLLRTFTRKEAILKARGTGFRVDPRGQPTAGIAVADRWTLTADGWWLFEPDIAGMLVCLAARAPDTVRLESSTFFAAPGS